MIKETLIGVRTAELRCCTLLHVVRTRLLSKGTMEALALKTEGAKLFAKGDFAAAALKYVEALQLLQSEDNALAGEDEDEWSQFNPDLGGNKAAAEALASMAAEAKDQRDQLFVSCALNA